MINYHYNWQCNDSFFFRWRAEETLRRVDGLCGDKQINSSIFSTSLFKVGLRLLFSRYSDRELQIWRQTRSRLLLNPIENHLFFKKLTSINFRGPHTTNKLEVEPSSSAPPSLMSLRGRPPGGTFDANFRRLRIACESQEDPVRLCLGQNWGRLSALRNWLLHLHHPGQNSRSCQRRRSGAWSLMRLDYPYRPSRKTNPSESWKQRPGLSSK